MTNLLDQALSYLADGLRPLPVNFKEKAPSLKTWKEYQKRAPTEEELAQWFASDNVNIGTVIPPGIIIIDFDGGKDAEKLLNDAGIILPSDMPRAQSGSGGYHGYLALPKGVADFTKIPGSSFLFSKGPDSKPCKPFVEILTVNNFVVLPPSIHPNGKQYKWLIELDELPEVPAALMALIESKRGNGIKTDKSEKKHKNEPGWVEELSKGSAYGTIDDSMTKLAGHYLKKRLSVANVIDIIDAGFAQRCTRDGKPFRVPIADIKRVVESIQRAEVRKNDSDSVDNAAEFRLLGYDHNAYFYLSRATGQVVELTAREHDKHNLLRVASLRYWEANYSTDNGIFWPGAQAKLIDAQHRIGIFDQERFRGRGAWWDKESGPIMHTGSNILIGGKSIPVKEFNSKHYIYELSKPLDIEIGNPLSDELSNKIMEVFDSISWEHPHHARLAAGWCVIATICGAVEWRPHIWVSGPSGSGKSWVIDSLIKRLLGNLAISAQSITTEAGLRQKLGDDARPVIFDEAEAEGQRDDVRMANVLGLIRQASSETGGLIIKGTKEGSAKSYRIRSCFAMSSINVSAYQAADKNRITILEMNVNDKIPQEKRDANFIELCKIVTDTFTDKFVASFRARCISMIPVIRQNSQILAVAASSIIGSRRLGDQVGTLLAGAYSLLSSEVLDMETAIELLKDQDLSQQKALKDINDENELLNHILQSIHRVQASFGVTERTVATLGRIAEGKSDSVQPPEAQTVLALIGIKTTHDGIIIANSHRGIKNILRETHWQKDWGRVLKRIPGSQLSGVVRIGDVTCRGVFIPWDMTE